MPSSIGIVASGEDVLNDAVFWVDAGRSSVVSGALSNLGTGGSALNAVFGNSTGVDSFDPALLAHTGTNYLYLPGVAGNAASATNLASYTPSSSLQLDWDFTPSDLTAAEQSLITHFGVAGNRGWRLSLGTTAFALVWSTDGGDVNVASQTVSFATMGVSVGVRSRGRVILRFNNGSGVYDVRWYTVDANGIATLVETDLGLSTTTIFASSQNLEVGTRTGLGTPLSASVYKATVTTDSTVVFNADFTTGITSGSQTTFTESSANAATVTINRSTSGRKAVAVTRPILLFGTDDYLEVADNDLLDFEAGKPFTVAIVTRQWNTMTSQGAALAKKTGSDTTGTGWLIRNGGGSPADTVFDTYDGTTATSRTAPTSKTSGALSVITGVASPTQLTAYFNNTASAATTRQAGGYANSEVMRIGRLSGAGTQYTNMELVAAAVWRRALTAPEIATIVAHYDQQTDAVLCPNCRLDDTYRWDTTLTDPTGHQAGHATTIDPTRSVTFTAPAQPGAWPVSVTITDRVGTETNTRPVTVNPPTATTPPPPVTNLRVDTTDGRFVISWDDPANPAAPNAIDSIVVYVNPAGTVGPFKHQTIWTGAHRTWSWDAATADSEYVVTVRTRNEAGEADTALTVWTRPAAGTVKTIPARWIDSHTANAWRNENVYYTGQYSTSRGLQSVYVGWGTNAAAVLHGHQPATIELIGTRGTGSGFTGAKVQVAGHAAGETKPATVPVPVTTWQTDALIAGAAGVTTTGTLTIDKAKIADGSITGLILTAPNTLQSNYAVWTALTVRVTF